MVGRGVERLRAELETETGIDFARYRDDAFVDAVTGWTGLVGVVKDLLVAMLVAGVVAVSVVAASLLRDGKIGTTVGAIVGGVVLAGGTFTVVFVRRIRVRIPAETDHVFVVTARMADALATEVTAGTIQLTPAQASRGLALVAAVPAITAVARRRFPVAGLVVAPVASGILSRTLLRLWPTGDGGEAIRGMDDWLHRLQAATARARAAVVPRVATTVRWVTLPLTLVGLALCGIGAAVTALALSAA